MSFPEAVKSVYSNYAKFDGRATRSEYWWFQLFLVLVVLVWFAGLIFLASVRTAGFFGLLSLGVLIFFLATLIPALAVSVRRLHDSDKSGWWMLITFVPYVGSFILLILMVLDSTPGYNRYGPPAGSAGLRPVIYWGATQWEAWQRFVDDSQRAAAAGWTPVRVDWQLDQGNQYLKVQYGYGPPDPTWNLPPWAPPPPNP